MKQQNYLIPVLKRKKSNKNRLNNQEQAGKSKEGYNNRQSPKVSSGNKSKGPTIIANTIGNVQTVDGDVTYNYDIEHYNE